VRGQSPSEQARQDPGVAEWRVFEAEGARETQVEAAIAEAHWVVNAIGVIKPYIHDDNAAEVERAVSVNALFPHFLARAAQKIDARVIQIATDCVYSGQKGQYVESDKHDALDAYGKTKSLGEVASANVWHLRCSIIGPERKAHVSLLDWFLGQKQGATVNGYTNHRWNGITTLHFAKLCRGVMTRDITLPHLQHVIPDGDITKCDLLRCFAKHFGREDVSIEPAEAGLVIDRTLGTAYQALNRQLWAPAGYCRPPSVPEMVAELAAYG
jgi:dTDP-4-dehydrorhamnose reductase